MRFIALLCSSTARQIEKKGGQRLTLKVRRALVDPLKVTAVFAPSVMNAKELESDPILFS
jgi:hypothetical protein